LDVFRWQNELQNTEIEKLKKGTATLQAQLIAEASEFKNTRRQLVETSLSKFKAEKSLALEIAKLKSINAKLQARGEMAAQILRRAPRKKNSRSGTQNDAEIHKKVSFIGR